MHALKFYDRTRLLYLETDSSGMSLGAGLLQARESMNCRCDEISDNVILLPVAFASKSLSSVKQCFSNIEQG